MALMDEVTSGSTHFHVFFFSLGQQVPLSNEAKHWIDIETQVTPKVIQKVVLSTGWGHLEEICDIPNGLIVDTLKSFGQGKKIGTARFADL